MAGPLDSASVLVLGGTSGIGLATARAALEAGARVTVTGRAEARLADAILARLGPASLLGSRHAAE